MSGAIIPNIQLQQNQLAIQDLMNLRKQVKIHSIYASRKLEDVLLLL